MFGFKKNKTKRELKQSKTGKTLVFSTGQPAYKNKDEKEISKEAYQKNVIAFQSINMIARGASYIKLNYFEGDKLITEHPLINLIQKPNESQSQQEFFESVYSYQLIHGNSYVEMQTNKEGISKADEPIYLYSLRPDRIRIIPGANGLPAAYEYTGNNGQKVRFPVTITGLSNILHIRTFNPLNDWYGMSSIEAAAYSIDQHNESSSWNLALLQNGARPSGALQYNDDSDGTLTDEQFQNLKNQMDEQYQGSKNAGKPLILEGGMSWIEMSISPKDMDYINTKNTSARDIALAFGVPPQLLGIPGDSTFNNMAEARLWLWENTIIPLTQKILTKFNNNIASRYDDNIRIEMDKDSIEALSVKRIAKAESLEKLTYVTVNEKREQIGLPAISGGDVLPNNTQDLPELSKNEYINSMVKSGISPNEAKKIAGLIYAD